MATRVEQIQELNALIAGKIHRRRLLNKEINRLRSQRDRLLHDDAVGIKRSGTNDDLVVPTVELKPYVEQAVKEYGGKRQLARKANVSARTITKILNLESRFTTVYVADALLSVGGYLSLLGSVVRVVPNPQFRPTVQDDDIDC